VRFLEVIGGWINRYFSHEEAIYLVVLLIASFLVLITLGGVLAPVLTGLVLAFLLQGIVVRLEHWRIPSGPAVYLTFVLFLGALIALMLFVFPLVWRQLSSLVNALPEAVSQLQTLVRRLPEWLPDLIDDAQVDAWLAMLSGELGGLGRVVLEGVLAQVPSVLGLTVYLVLVPFSVFFFLRDRDQIIAWVASQLPRERPLLDQVGSELNVQIANYVRGKAVEILIVGSVTFVVFTILGLNYAALLGVIVGLSVLVPFIGAAVATLPVALVGVLQWGWSLELVYVLGAYAVIQALDGNVLLPLLVGEAVDLHPIAIIVAVLVFGGLWGFWGVFFAIPLATLFKAVSNAWPGHQLDPLAEPAAMSSEVAVEAAP